jgi:hypothetical protein
VKKLWKLGVLSILLVGAFTACKSPQEKLESFVNESWNPAKDSIFAAYKQAGTTVNFTNRTVKEMAEATIYYRYFDSTTVADFVSVSNKQKSELQLQSIMFEAIKTMVQVVEQQDLAFDKALMAKENATPDFEALQLQGKLLADSCLALKKKYTLAFTQSNTAAYNNNKYFNEQLELEIALFNNKNAAPQGK